MDTKTRPGTHGRATLYGPIARGKVHIDRGRHGGEWAERKLAWRLPAGHERQHEGHLKDVSAACLSFY